MPVLPIIPASRSREREIVDLIGAAETFPEVLDAAEVLYKYCKERKDEETKIIVIVNSSKVFNITVKPHHGHLLPLGLMVDIDYVRIDDTVNVFYEMKFDNEFREIFKRKSYLKYEI
jgi:hypothetical protein